ncbi:BnaA10g27310D [Brassica napus]|uniref:BnaA10g27310D protein n=1 Tax=Brassica napus TaxID=3708 RepID=A0A078HR71_BRANA|nr:BnaA10g27310D [Brassica napus]
MENIKLRRAKEADQDICAIKTPYLTNQEEFIHETGFAGFYTQHEHVANFFHIKRINGLEDMPFSSQGWPDLTYLEDQWFSQLQTKHWRPRDLSMQSGDTSKGPEESGTFLTCTRKHRIT